MRVAASTFTARLAATPEALQRSVGSFSPASPRPQVSASGSLFAAPQPVGIGSLTADAGGVVSIATGHFDQSGNLDAAAIVCTQCSGPYDAPYQYSAGSNSQYSVVVLPGNGDGTFATPTVLTPAGPGVPLSMILATDLGNGETDLVVAEGGNRSGTAQILVYLGNGDGTFQTPPIAVDAAPGFGITRIAAANLGDGHVDLVATLSVGAYGDSQVEVFTGDGTGHFTADTPIPLCTASESGCPGSDAITDLAVAPLSQGGSPDILVSQYTGYVENNGYEDSTDTLAVLVNNGSGSFSAPSFPVTDMDYTTGIEVGNFTGPSGPPELLLIGGCLGVIAPANAQSNTCQILLHGNGDGTFETPTTANADATYLDGDSWRGPSANSPVDLTGSGALDALWLPTYVGSNEPGFAEAMLNNGSGSFTLEDVVDVLPPDVQPTTIVAAQLTASGPPDLLVGGVPINNPASDDSPNPGLWVVPANAADPGTYKSGTGLMSNAEVAAGALASRADPSLAVGDFGLTGNEDLVSAFCAVECEDLVIDTLPNNGDGTFGALQGDLLTGNTTGGQPEIGMVSGDWSGNGKLDLAWPDQDGGLTYLLGNGDGTFQNPVHVNGNDTLASYPTCCSVAATTLDGVPDIVEATGNNSQRYLESWLWKNGTFSAPVLSGPLTAIPYGSSVAAFGQILPGDPIDAVTMVEGSSGSPVVEVIPGDADGSFDTAAPVVVATACPDAVGAVATGDLRANGLDDVLWECDGNLYVALNNGNGTFATPQAYPESLPATNSNLMLADVEGDDHPDAIAWGDNAGSGVEVWHNNGDGTFAAAGAYSVGNPTTSASVVAGALTSSGTQDLIALDLSATNDMVTVLTALSGRPALEATSVSAVSPASPVPGQTMSGSYSVTDTGAAVSASWEDSIYLAPGASGTTWSGSDTLLARLPETQSLAPQASYSQSFSVPFPDVAPGTYHLVVVPDSSDVLAGTNETPAASPSFTAQAIPTLEVGSSQQSSSLVAGQTLWYEVPVSAGPDVQVSLSGLPAGSGTVLYASQGQVPAPGSASIESQSGSIVLPASEPGGWYLTVVLGSGPALNGATLTIAASTLGLTLRSVSPSSDGVPTFFVPPATATVASSGGGTVVHTQLPPIPPAGDGELTLTLQGSGFGPGTSVQLVSSSGSYPASSVTVSSSTVLFASFAVPYACRLGVAEAPSCADYSPPSSLQLGTYDVVVTSGASSVTLPSAFTLDSAGYSADSGTSTAPALSVSFSTPALLRYGWSTYLDLTLTDNSSQDLAVPVIDVSSPNALFQLPGASPSSSFTSSVEIDDPVLSDNAAVDPAPPGILQGGSSVTLQLSIAAATDVPHELLETDASILSSGDTTPIDWASVLAPDQTSEMSSADWSGVVSQFGTDFGTTNGSFASSLVTAFDEARTDGADVQSESDAIGFLVDEVEATNPATAVNGTLYAGDSSQPLGDVALSLTSTTGGATYTGTSWYDGQFAFYDVAPGSYQLSTTGDPSLELQSVDVAPTAQGLSVDDPADAGLTGSVLDESGDPVSGALVTVTDADGEHSGGPTGSDGSYTVDGLLAGEVTVSAAAEGLVTSSPETVTVSAGTATTDNLALSAGSTLTGTIEAPGGGAPTGAEVQAFSATSALAIDGTLGTDGSSFSIGGLAAGTYTVVASGSDGAPTSQSVTVDGTDSYGPITLTLGAPQSLSGVVTDADTGAPLSGVTVYSDAPGTDGEQSVSGADGSFTLTDLPAGTQDIHFDPSDTSYLSNVVTLDPSTTSGQISVSLTPTGTLTGQLETAGGQPVAGATLTVVEPNVNGDAASSLADELVTDADGNFGLSDLAPGDYVVQVPGSDVEQSFTIADGSRQASIDLSLPGGMVSGEVLDASGNPVAGVPVTISGADGPFAETLTDSNGDYQFVTTAGEAVDLVAESPSTGVLIANDVAASASSDVEVTPLQAGTASYRVTVEGPSGSPVSGATLVLNATSEDGSVGSVAASTGASGVATFSNLTPGSYELVTSDDTDAALTEQVNVAAEGGSTTVQLGAGASITGTVTTDQGADVAGALVEAVDEQNGQAASTETASDGTYTLDGLSASDTFDISVGANGDAPVVLSGVAAGSTANAVLPTSGATLTVQLEPDGGGVLPAGTVSLVDSNGVAVLSEQLGPARSASDEAASATFGPLTPGSYTVSFVGAGTGATSESVSVPAAGTSVELSAPSPEGLATGTTATASDDAQLTAPRDATRLLVGRSAPQTAEPAIAGAALSSSPRQATSGAPSQQSIASQLYSTWLSGLFIPRPNEADSQQALLARALHDLQTINGTCPNVLALHDKVQGDAQSLIDALMHAQQQYDDMETQLKQQLLDLSVKGAAILSSMLAALAGLGAAGLAEIGTTILEMGSEEAAAWAADVAELFPADPELVSLLTATQTLSTGVAAAEAVKALYEAAIDGVENPGADTLGSFGKGLSDITKTISKALKAAGVTALGQVGKVDSLMASTLGNLYKALNLLTQYNNLVSDVQNMLNNLQTPEDQYNHLLVQLNADLKAYESVPNQSPPCSPPPLTLKPISNFNPQVVDPNDPNELIGPPGDGSAAQYIPPGSTLPYTVLFANDGSAPASIVEVSVPLPAGTVPSSLQLTGFGFGSTSVPLSRAGSSFSELLSGLDLANGDDVSASGSYDAGTNTVNWTIEAINPATGDVDGTPAGGFLPPDDAAGDGEGYVSFSLQAKPGLATGTSISTTASVVFDANAAISTDTWTNTVDATPPEASVAALPARETSPFTVSWSGTTPGSAIVSYDVYVSEDGDSYELWQSATAATSAPFTGSIGHSYAFVAVATDGVGNVQPFPNDAQAVTTVVAPASGGGSGGSAGGGGGTSAPAAPQPTTPAQAPPAAPHAHLAVALFIAGPGGRVTGLGAARGRRLAPAAKRTVAVAAIAATPDGGGYWLAGRNGHVVTAGDAHLYPARRRGTISGPVVAMAAMPDGKGYFLATAQGHVYAYGDARVEAGHRSPRGAGTVMAIVTTADGRGYWLASTSGKVVAYGDARAERRIGSAARGPFVAMATTPDGKGYWLAAADGQVEAFGDATVERGQRVDLHSPVVAMAATPDGKGYWLATADGHVYAYGDASRDAATPRARVLGQVVAMAAS
ncbi:MAG TPA: carboxypeptidase regulatory-like domain-containing protein [Acidimicrobiales bacterium]|nr:carboxypeptidase regulatory-like domain-containing protein [Acidimicrobiales bacterium]